VERDRVVGDDREGLVVVAGFGEQRLGLLGVVLVVVVGGADIAHVIRRARIGPAAIGLEQALGRDADDFFHVQRDLHGLAELDVVGRGSLALRMNVPNAHFRFS
jgi:hypothetical protein